MELSRITAAARRQYLYFFVRSVFGELHGGNQPSDAPYLEAMCCALQQVAQQDGGRLLVTIPPRHLKSITAAVALPAWVLGHDPSKRVMIATYGEELSREHADTFRRVISSAWYQALFPRFQVRSSTHAELKTTWGGSRRSVSLGGATTGFGADLIIVDDLMKAQDTGSQARREAVYTYFRDALLSRFNNPNTGSLISIQQRLHEDDLPARLIATGQYDHLNLPAIAERTETHALYNGRRWTRDARSVLDARRMNQKRLETLRAELGSAVFSAQYQQNPVAPEGAVIHVDQLNFSDAPPARDTCERVIQSWDTAAKTGPQCDYSACTTWGYRNETWHLLNIFRAKLEYPDLKARVLQLKNQWRADRVLIEDSSTGTASAQQFRADRVDNIHTIKARGSKLERLVPHLDLLQSDAICFATRLQGWDDFVKEMAAFPEGRHDDQVDSMSQFFGWLRGRRGRAYMDKDPVTGRRRMLNRR